MGTRCHSNSNGWSVLLMYSSESPQTNWNKCSAPRRNGKWRPANEITSKCYWNCQGRYLCTVCTSVLCCATYCREITGLRCVVDWTFDFTALYKIYTEKSLLCRGHRWNSIFLLMPGIKQCLEMVKHYFYLIRPRHP